MGLEIFKSFFIFIFIMKCNFKIDFAEFKTHFSNRPNTYKKYNLQRNIRSKHTHISPRVSISIQQFLYIICTDVCILKILIADINYNKLICFQFYTIFVRFFLLEIMVTVRMSDIQFH